MKSKCTWMLSFYLLAMPYIAQAGESVSVRFCYEDQALPPFFFGSGLSVPKELPGIYIDLLMATDDALPEVEFQYFRAPWRRCLAFLGDGQVSAVMSSYSEQRKHLGKYPPPAYKLDFSRNFSESSAYCLFVQKGTTMFWDRVAFTNPFNQPIAVPLGYSIREMLQQFPEVIIDVESNQKAFQLLSLGRVGGVATRCGSGKYFVQDLGLTNITVNPYTLSSTDSYLLFSYQFYDQHPDLSERIWKTLAKINHERFPQIAEGYFTK